jgi:cytochrome c peroxidase
MKHIKIILACILALIALIPACSVDPAVKDELPSNDIHLILPTGWPYPANDFSQDPLNENGFVLGRRLFYDKRLSSDNSISCGSCHQQFAGFAHKDKVISPGVNGALGNRNAPALLNLNWQTEFMWDGRILHLLDQPISPITNPVEMNETVDHVLMKINFDPEYRKLFKAAYGSETATEESLKKALSQFMGMLVTAGSKYDQYLAGETSLSLSETNGMLLFQSHCNGCHTAPLFSNFSYRNNGLDSTFSDAGRANVTMLAADSGTFKVPTLRNIALSKPYMHDGRFATLEQVLDHYSNGIMNSATLDTSLAGGFNFTSQEKEDLIAFLKTLTDEKFVRDKRFNDPFNN